MAFRERLISVDEFEAIVQLPENADKLFEYIAGELFEVPSNPFASKIASRISGFIFMYLLKNNIGHLTGEAGGYRVAGELYAPDVAFIGYDKQAILATQGYNPNPPDLAIEVISSQSKAENEKMTIKLGNYLAVGTVVWIVRPEAGYIEVHQTGKPVQIFGSDAEISGGDILPDFQLKVSDIFQ